MIDSRRIRLLLALFIAAACFAVAPVMSAEPNDSRFQQLIDEREKLIAEFRATEESDSEDETIALVERLAGVERKLAAGLGRPKSAAGQQLRVKVLNSFDQTLTWLSSRYIAREQFERAIKTRQELVTLRSGLLGKNHPKTTDARVALMDLESRAKLTDDQREELAQADRLHDEAIRSLRAGQLQRALELEQQVLQTSQKILGNQTPLVAATHQYVGHFCQRAGDFERAAQHLRIAERLRRHFWGRNHPEWRNIVDALANVLNELGNRALADDRLEEAGRYQSERLALLIDRYGATDWHVTDAMYLVADISRLAQLPPDDLEKLSKAVALNDEAVQWYGDREYEKAEDALREALATREQLRGRYHPNTIVTLYNLAHVLKAQEQLVEASALLREVMLRRRRGQGIQHPMFLESQQELLGILEVIADAAKREEDFDTALAAQRDIIPLRIALFGANDYRVTDAQLAVADIERMISMDPKSRDQLHHAEQLNARVGELYRSGGYAQAASLAQSTVEIRRRILGDQHPNYATSLSNLALMYKEMGEFARAEPLMVEARAIREKTLGKEHPDYASSLNNLAELYRARGDYTRAQPLYLEAKAIRQKVLGDEHPDYATSLNNLALLYIERGDYARAEPLYVKAKAIREQALGKNHPLYVLSLINLAGLYYEMADYARAEPLYVEAEAIRRKEFGKDHPDYAVCLGSLGLLYAAMGDYAQAEPLYVEAKAIMEMVFGREHPDYATSLSNLALLYREMGEFARAEPLMVEAKAIRQRKLGKEHPAYVVSLIVLASLYHAMGDYGHAEPLLVEAKAIREKVLGKNHPDYASCLNSLAMVYEVKGDYARAEPLMVEANAIQAEVLGKEHPDYALGLNNLAVLYQEMGDYARAAPLLIEAKAIFEKRLGKNHPHYALSLSNLAGLRNEMKDDARAESLYLEAKAIFEKTVGKRHPHYALSLINLAKLYHGRRDYSRAQEHCQKAIDITLNHLDETAYVLSERQQLLMNQSVRYQLDYYLWCCLQGDLDPQDAIARLVAWKGSILLRQRGLRLAAGDPSIAEPLRKLQSLAIQLSTTISSIPDQGRIEAWKQRITLLTEEKEKLEAELMRGSAAFRQAKKKITLDSVRQAIPSDAVLVDYLEYGSGDQRRLLASVIRSQGNLNLIDLGSAGSVSKAIDTWLASYGMRAESQEAGLEIRKQIWEPLAGQIKDAELILISTDGVLGKLPFAALPGARPDSYLIEEHRIALIPVPQLLPALVNEQGGKPLRRELLLVGDVDYEAQPDTKAESADAKDKPVRRKRPWERNRPLADSLRGGSKWGALSETGEEVEVIAGLYRRLYDPEDDAVLDLRKTEATESAFRQHAPQCMLLHLATHGFFAAPEAKSALSAEAIAESQRDPVGRFGGQRELIRGHSPGQLSGLVFAGANHPPQIDPLAEQTPDDGIMTADEIAFLPLGGVRLAVLSACETGLGEVAGGEGLLGIQRSFQVAGARTTIATLWKVNDPATRRLMGEFYTNYLEKEMSIVDALRETQLWALNHPGDVPRGAKRVTVDEAPKRLEPQFWAPFVLSGDWR